MNFRKLLTYLTVSTAAVIPFAGAQNPTILQGSYISNVFGNSNFVKNPNGQTNVANVTNATRSTTTPLVATSEFNLNLTSGTFATWTLRAFDAGMKGQNCEARFSYRGFATATTTAEIVQNSLVVAQLVLTPSTDPRIASINFPCGDLANLTTFRIAQTTANMTGTNEIGGIYVGLATNMANVAQAETVVRAYSNATQPLTIGTYNTIIYGDEQSDVYGEYDSGTGIFTAKRAGNYLVNASVDVTANNCAVDGNMALNITKNNNTAGTGSIQVDKYTEANANYKRGINVSGIIPLTIGETIRVNFYPCVGVTKTVNAFVNFLTISRFPSSSELVVTPERQNTFAGVKGVASSTTNTVTTNAWTKLTSGTTLTRTNFGKAKVETNNDYSITIDNMPVGSYYITATGLLYSASGSSGVSTECWFGFADTATGGAQIAGITAISTGDASSTVQANSANTLGGVYTVSAVASKTFFLQAYRSAGNGSCQGFSRPDTPLTITVIPLDQPSNSALYVQGPVLGAQTGAAIPEGYVNEFATRSITDTSSRQQSTPTAGTFYYPWTSTLTLPSGNWLLCYKAIIEHEETPASGAVAFPRMHIQNQTDSTDVMTQAVLGTLTSAPFNIAYIWGAVSQCKPIAITSSKTFRLGIAYQNNTGTASVLTLRIRGDLSQTELYAVRLN